MNLDWKFIILLLIAYCFAGIVIKKYGTQIGID